MTSLVYIAATELNSAQLNRLYIII